MRYSLWNPCDAKDHMPFRYYGRKLDRYPDSIPTLTEACYGVVIGSNELKSIRSSEIH